MNKIINCMNNNSNEDQWNITKKRCEFILHNIERKLSDDTNDKELVYKLVQTFGRYKQCMANIESEILFSPILKELAEMNMKLIFENCILKSRAQNSGTQNEIEYYDEYELSQEFADKIKLLPFSKKPDISTKTLTKAYDCSCVVKNNVMKIGKAYLFFTMFIFGALLSIEIPYYRRINPAH